MKDKLPIADIHRVNVFSSLSQANDSQNQIGSTAKETVGPIPSPGPTDVITCEKRSWGLVPLRFASHKFLGVATEKPGVRVREVVVN